MNKKNMERGLQHSFMIKALILKPIENRLHDQKNISVNKLTRERLR